MTETNEIITPPVIDRPLAKKYIAIFGGTFDPIHLGHIKLAEEVIARDLVDEVMFVPAAKPPHKLNNKITSAEHRLAMINLVLSQYPKFSLSDYEIVNDRKISYTVNTLRAIQAAYPKKYIKLMMGMDNFLELNSWYKFQDIISDFEIIVFTRPDTRKISMAEITEKFGHRYADKLFNSVIEIPGLNISSTTIRKNVMADKSLDNLVIPTVANYINQNGLYK